MISLTVKNEKSAKTVKFNRLDNLQEHINLISSRDDNYCVGPCGCELRTDRNKCDNGWPTAIAALLKEKYNTSGVKHHI